MKTTAVVHSRGGRKEYLCLHHQLCFPNPNSAAANEGFSKYFSKTNLFTCHLVFTRHIIFINSNSFVIPYKYWKFNALRIISSSLTKGKLKSLPVLLKIELPVLVGCVLTYKIFTIKRLNYTSLEE